MVNFEIFRFSPKSYFDQTFITRFDRYRCFSDYFRFNGHFRLHGTILTRPMTQFNSLTITPKRNQADTLHPLDPNFRKKNRPSLKKIRHFKPLPTDKLKIQGALSQYFSRKGRCTSGFKIVFLC